MGGRHPVHAWVTGRMPGAESVREVRVHLAHPALTREPRDILREDLRPAGDQRARQGGRRHVRLLRLHAEAAGRPRPRDLSDIGFVSLTQRLGVLVVAIFAIAFTRTPWLIQ